jgi:hypothetical protein
MLVSDSTHIPPTGTNRPSATRSATRAKTSGRFRSIHSKCWAEDIANTRSGYSSIRWVTLEQVRATLRIASRIGHNHAESM